MTWPEQKKPIVTNKGKVENKAPIHRKVAIGSQTVLSSPLQPLTEAEKFIDNPIPYINEFAPLYAKTQHIEKWTARKDYITLIIKKSAQKNLKLKEAEHFIMYLNEIKEDAAKIQDISPIEDKIKSLKYDISIYNNLISQINAADTIQKLDDLNQDANNAEIKGQITNAQLNEIYMLINNRDEQVRKDIKTKQENLQSQYHVGDYLERLPDVDTVIKPGIYKITEIIPHKIMSFGNVPTEFKIENEYRIAAIKPDGTAIPIGGFVLTTVHLSNTFKKTTFQRQGEINRTEIDQTVRNFILIISKISSPHMLNEVDKQFHDLISRGELDVMSHHVQDIAQAIAAKRRELASTSSPDEYIKRKIEYETEGLEYEARHPPKEILPHQDIDPQKHIWGLSEQEAIQRYAEKELSKYQSNINYTQKEKERLDEIVKSKPHVLLTKAQIQKQYPEKANEMLTDLWNYKSLKSTYEKNMQSASYWQSKVEKIKSGEWQKINTNYLREQYQKEVKEAIKHGKPVQPEVISQYSEFTKAQDNRERYEKGWKTSFANKSIAVDESLKSIHGIKIKRQDGKAMTKEQADEIVSDLKDIQSVIGDITPILKKEDITIAHTSGKNPFLSQAGGVYHPVERTVTVGTGAKASAHEIAHAIDYAGHTTSEPLYNFQLLGQAKATMNTGAERAMSLKNKEGEELKEARAFRARLGKYWTRPEEIFARLFEQYVSYKHPESSTAHYSFKHYTETPAWWSESSFMEMLPILESEVQRKIELAKR